MTNSTNAAVGNSESAVANGNKASEKVKPSADEHTLVKDELVKGKPALDHIDFVRDPHNRVTLYELNDLVQTPLWEVETEVGHVNCVQSRDQPNELWIVVRLESNDKIVLESRILPDTIYQTYDGSIIWLEPDVGKLKLRFHVEAGYTEIWYKIFQIQLERKREVDKEKSALDRIDFVRNTRNRVVLYKLNDHGVWRSKGNGHVTCVQSQNQPDSWWIIVRRESRKKNLLESRILPDTIYEKQRGTVIVWLEPDVGKLALSFYVQAGYTEILDKICQIQREGKLRREAQTSREAQLQRIQLNFRQTSENNLQLTRELNILQAKNRNILERNRELEQELNISQANVRDLESKFDQMDVRLKIAVLKEKVDKLENGEILRLQKENAKLSNENDIKNQENIELRKKLVELEYRFADMNKEKADMSDELKNWDYVDQQLIRITEFAEEIRKKKKESKDKQSFHDQSPPRLDPIMPQAVLKQQCQEEDATELGPDGDSTKGSTQKNLKEAGAKNAENVTSGSKADII